MDSISGGQADNGAQYNSKEWYEAKYILHIKEKYALSQVAVDHVLTSTKLLVSDILSGITNDLRASIPPDVLETLENKFVKINQSLFKTVSSPALQKKYFKEHFNLVVSIKVLDTYVHITDTLCFKGTSGYHTWWIFQMEKKKNWAKSSAY